MGRLTNEEAVELGKRVREACDEDIFVGNFAADLTEKPHPLSKAEFDVVFKNYEYGELGRRFQAWLDAGVKEHRALQWGAGLTTYIMNRLKKD